uniref:Uncharacterized protein n=1 Tax=Anguilla anguilla TaxID=7936 RepID=A0A0E9UWT6_ANGAN
MMVGRTSELIFIFKISFW